MEQAIHMMTGQIYKSSIKRCPIPTWFFWQLSSLGVLELGPRKGCRILVYEVQNVREGMENVSLSSAKCVQIRLLCRVQCSNVIFFEETRKPTCTFMLNYLVHLLASFSNFINGKS